MSKRIPSDVGEVELRWQPADHPANNLPAAAAEAVGEAFGQIPCQEPTEMYRVQMERREPMVYMPFATLNQIIWELAEKISSTSSGAKTSN